MAIKRSFILSSGIGVSVDNLFVVNNTNSVSSTTGSIVLSGGIGIGQSASISGRLQMFYGSNYTAFVSSASGNTVYTLPATSPATGSSVLQSTSAGVMSWVPMTATGGGGAGTVYDGSLNSIPYYPTAGTAITGSLSFTNTGTSINIGYTTAATNSSSGALTIVGGVGIGGSLYVAGDLTINGTTTTINSVTLTVDDKNIELGSVVTPSDVTAEGGGITLRGASDKSINWYTGTGWSSSESFNLVSGSTYKINNITVISNSSIGTGITNSSLTALGTITTGVWSGTSITAYYGGTGLQTTFTVGDLLYANTSFTWARLTANSNSGYVLTSAGSGATPTYVAQSTLSVGNATTSGIATTAQNINVISASTNANHPLLFTPSFGSASGLAVSSNTTLVYNPSSDILSVSGAAITSTTASNTASTGSLVVTGGVGIGQSVSVGGRLQLFNSSNYTAFVSSATGNTVYTLPATSPATGSSVLQSTSAGILSWVPMTAGAASGNTAQNIVVNTAGNANVFHPVLFTPSSLSAGSAVSSDSTISFNPSTEILNVSGLAITSGTASTNTTTGALVVRGGLGVTGQLSFAQASFGFTGITTNPTMSFIGATSASPITLTVLTDNSLNFEGSQGSVFSIDSNLSSGEIFSVSDISGLPIISASAGQTVNINEFGGFTQIGNGSINSSSTTTGSLVVSGGLGLTGNANIGGTVRITSTTASTTSSSGALVVSGGVGIGLSASIGGRLLLFNGANYTALVSSATGNTIYTLPATSPATGTSVLVSTSAGVWSWASPSSVGNSSGGTTDGTVQYKSGSGFAGTSSFFYDTALYALRLSNFPGGETPSSTSAALKVEQTTGSFNGSVNGTMIAVNANNGFTGDLLNLQTNAITKFRVDANGAIGMSSSLTTSGDLSIFSATPSTNTTSGALQVRGGLGITGNAFIGGTTTITNTTASVSSSSGALVVAGGVGIGQTLFIGGNLYQNTNAITAFDTGFRNRIINGDGNIDQRSDGSSTTPGVGATNFIDRWKMNVFGSGRLTIGKNYGAISSPDGFVSYIGMKTTTTSTPGANDYNFLSQVIEGVNTIDLQWGTANAKSVTLSFWAYSSLTGTFGGSIRNYGTYNRSYPFTYTISSSNTWEKKTVVISGDTTGTWTTSHLFGIEIIFSIANGTGYQATPFAWAAGNYIGPSGSLVNLIGTLNATLYLTGIQAEIGSVATPYERRNYGHEFALCQRYYQITEVRTGGYHTTGNYLRGSVFLNTAARPISSPVFTVLSTDESNNHGTLNVDNTNFRGDSFRYLVQVTTTGDAFGQWKVGADFEF